MVVGEISQNREVVIIGGGPGGYHAAIRAAQHGLAVTLIEQKELGGTCLHEGCIPSKLWAYVAKEFVGIPQLAALGIQTNTPTLHINQLHQYKINIAEQLKKGVQTLCEANQIEVLKGKASFLAEDRIGVENGHQFDTYTFEKAIIATGCEYVLPAQFHIGSNHIYCSSETYQLNELPNHVLVHGNDYIAIEVASVFADLGSKVTFLLTADDFPFDVPLQKELTRICKKKKIKLIKGADIKSVVETNAGLHVIYKSKHGEVAVQVSHLYTSGIKKVNKEWLGIDRLHMQMTEDGSIAVNEKFETSVHHILAIGDVIDGPPLAVRAIKEGKHVAHMLANESSEYDFTFLPTVIHSNPPIVTVGLTEKEATTYGYEAKSTTFPLQGNGFRTLTGKREGIISVVVDVKTDIIVGMHMIGEGAVELSSTFVQLLEMVAKVEDVTFPNYAHPSVNESLLEVLEAMTGYAIHVPPRVKTKA